ncbi:40-residue YVTN family beta-propeller repeat-containing protein [Pseudoxanthomonas sp. GM95]|uniref:YncE family protein n=1 Tax=Pseudoxanthomonas sp. GM95 TaxID=1881043 RepID=UPI0008D42151|nr:YncE family protein [Pseudoxanthomonas sp. GM95]SEL54197.1 40-residue YVTN family beta-propeller repeat-containing protein [Pseudoxanthomonas sp. GM95]
MSFSFPSVSLSRLLRVSALALALGVAPNAWAQQGAFTAPDTSFAGKLSLKTPVAYAGETVELAGEGFKPGQQVTLSRGTRVLNAQPYIADAQGKFTAALQVPADAAAGRHPLLVNVAGPDAAEVFELKVSPKLELSGDKQARAHGAPLVRGLYQSAYSARSNAVFVTSAVGRPPVKQSELVKVDPKTLKILARVTPQTAPAPEARPDQPAREASVYAVYGVGVDDANGHVWVTNTRQGTVAVYRQSDLALVKQFPAEAVPHSRDVIVDEVRGKAYVSATGETHVAVFDTRTLEHLKDIQIDSAQRGEKFTPTSLALDTQGGKLFSASIGTPEAVVIDTATDTVEKVIALGHATSAIGVGWDGGAKRLLVVAQGSDNLLIVDPASGRVEHDVPVGAGPLNVAVDPVSGLAYVSNRASGTLAVVDRSGKVVANLDGGTLPNHVHADGKGAVYAVNKSRGEDDPKGDRITRIVSKR